VWTSRAGLMSRVSPTVCSGVTENVVHTNFFFAIELGENSDEHEVYGIAGSHDSLGPIGNLVIGYKMVVMRQKAES
jgi:hypothetical protein